MQSDAHEESHRRGGLLALAVILIGHFVVRWPFRNVPLVRDEGEYAHLGQELLRGALPYLDVYNQKTPFAFVFAAAVQAVAGESVAALRIAVTLWVGVAALLIFLLARRLFDLRAAIGASLAFCVMVFDQSGVMHPASAEVLMLPWTLTALLLALTGAGRGRLVVAGGAAGLAWLTKQSGIVVIAFLVAERIWRLLVTRSEACDPRLGARDLGLLLAGFALPIAAVLIGFAARGGLDAFLECTVWNNVSYVGARQDGVGALGTLVLAALLRVARSDLGLWLLGAATLAMLARSAAGRPAGGLWILLVGTSVVALSGGKPFVHYYEPLIVPLALGVGVGSGSLLSVALGDRSGAPARGAPYRAGAAVLLLVVWAGPLLHGVRTLADPARTVAAHTAASPLLELAPEVAAYLKQRTRPGEPILVIGSEPQIYFHAARPAASRMAFTYPMTGDYPFAPALFATFRSELEAAGPRYVVVVRAPASLSERREYAQRFLATLSPVLEKRYRREARFPAAGDRVVLAVMRRRDAASSGGEDR